MGLPLISIPYHIFLYDLMLIVEGIRSLLHCESIHHTRQEARSWTMAAVVCHRQHVQTNDVGTTTTTLGPIRPMSRHRSNNGFATIQHYAPSKCLQCRPFHFENMVQ